MAGKEKKRSILTRIRNYFIAGVVVLIPIGITIYLTLFLISISSRILPKEINPNNYLPYDIPGLEIIMSIILITIIASLKYYYYYDCYFTFYKYKYYYYYYGYVYYYYYY